MQVTLTLELSEKIPGAGCIKGVLLKWWVSQKYQTKL
jgi:hypothetical protein